MGGRDIELYAGMNLPMVIEFINANLTGAEAHYQSRAAKESIVKVNDLLASFDDDEDE